jgi:two-component system OmpR family response regulator
MARMKERPRILIVDDDSDITDMVSAYLERFGFNTSSAWDGDGMRSHLSRQLFDLVILDINLPGTDGFKLAQEIRLASRLPVIFLTGRSDTFDRIAGLECGADDYIVKPFEPRELVARIQTVLRRSNKELNDRAHISSNDLICFDGWELRREDRRLTSPKGMIVELTNSEYKLLTTFLATPRRLFSRDQLIEHMRGKAMDAFDRSIDLLVSRLRQKLSENAGAPSFIKTVRGAGYLFNVEFIKIRTAWPA